MGFSIKNNNTGSLYLELNRCLFDLILNVPVNNFSVMSGRDRTKRGLMCLAQGPQRSDIGVARTRNPLVLSQALYH